MVKNIQSQGRVEWPATSSSQRGGVVRRRKDPKGAYYNTSKSFQRGIAGLATPAVIEGAPSRKDVVDIHQISPLTGQSVEMEYMDYLNYRSPSTGTGFHPPHQFPPNGQAGGSWYSNSMISYTLPIHPPNPPQPTRNESSSPIDVLPAPIYNNELQQSPSSPNGSSGQGYSNEHQFSTYQTAPAANTYTPNADNISPSEQFAGSEGYDSMAMSVANTVASSISDNYVCPPSNASFGSSGSASLSGLTLPDGFYESRLMVNHSPISSISPAASLYIDGYPVENDYSTIMDWNTDDYPTETGQFATAILTHQQYPESSPVPNQRPWNSQYVHASTYGAEPDAGCVAFEPSRGTPYDAYISGEQFLESNQQDRPEFKPLDLEPVSPAGTDDWHIIPSHPASSLPSHGSPHSEGSPWSRLSSPPLNATSPQSNTDENHSHVFSAYPGVPSPKLARGRQRALTSQEKREALDVRKAKACWACHLSKIKCSPCSPGSPCQQCERLSGKRRFCWLPCFNDPLEMLQPMMIPEYLFRDFTRSKVETFVSKNAISWGSHEMTVNLNWGYSRPLRTTVVAITLREESQAYMYETLMAGTEEEALVKRRSAPLGLPLASMDDMKDEYYVLAQDIVTKEIQRYVDMAYDDQNSDFPECLLQAVANFYSAGLAAGDECEALRQTLEMHLTSTILETSLCLDDASMSKVESHLGEKYETTAASLCATRQIKAAFLEVQAARISKVLETWGNMMWTANKNTPAEKKWAWSFSVLITLTLVMDKILQDAYWSCENRIANGNADAKKERADFRRLVKLIQTDLFERCKEIFHSSFKTRKGGKEACNPIRDGIRAFRGNTVNEGISRFIWDLDVIMRQFGPEIRLHKSARSDEEYPDEMRYTNTGRLASIFLADFLDH